MLVSANRTAVRLVAAQPVGGAELPDPGLDLVLQHLEPGELIHPAGQLLEESDDQRADRGVTLRGGDPGILRCPNGNGVSPGMGGLWQLLSGLAPCVLFVLRYPKLKITPLVPCPQLPLDGIASGIFPYLGGSVGVDQLRSIAVAYESVIVPGRQEPSWLRKYPAS